MTPLSGAPPIKGEVDSIARGISDTQNPTGSNLLQNVKATFEWVRLAQRIPVRIKLINVPKDTILSSGMTVTVSIIQGLARKRSALPRSNESGPESTGMAQIRMAGINIDLWTFSKFLSKRPIKDAYAEIETPETSGLTPADTSVESGILEGVSGTAGSPQQAGRKGLEDREQLWQQPAPGGYNLGIR